ncbi:MAG: ornithine carbamoyltransferase [Deltaproteobacteria bacterium]|nr:ornithine carbamoyltransferase [Deltaproteobacteria bacterium]
MEIKNRNFLKLLDFNPEEIKYLLNLSAGLKKAKKQKKEIQKLKGKNIALIFEKTSTRTRCAFEVAAYDQGANVTYIEPTGSQMSKKESLKDTARVLGRLYDAIEYRGFEQEKIEILAEYAKIPVFNGLTNEFHPTQALADFLTISEYSAKPINKIKLAYIGDARNNVANSLLICSAKLGASFTAIAPTDIQPDKTIIKQAQKTASETGANISITDNIPQGLKDTDFIYTDIWVSMGEPENIWEKRIKLLKDYQVNSNNLKLTGNPNVKFMHCLPAYHNRQTEIGEAIYQKFGQKFGLDGIEVTEDVFESKASIIFDQAENRLHTIKAIMTAILSD